MNGFFIAGTDTEIGKTLITALLTLGLRRRGVNVCPVKPIASGGIMMDGALASPDALVYKRFCGINESVHNLCPVCFKHPASPHLAAEMEGQVIEPQKAIEALDTLHEKYPALIVEGIGGWLVPVTYDYSMADFAVDLNIPVILVSANKLGTLNHTLLTIESIRNRGMKLAGIIITHPAPPADQNIALNNIETIERIGKTEILGNIPYLGQDIEEKESAASLWPQIQDAFQWQIIHQLLNTQ